MRIGTRLLARCYHRIVDLVGLGGCAPHLGPGLQDLRNRAVQLVWDDLLADMWMICEQQADLPESVRLARRQFLMTRLAWFRLSTAGVVQAVGDVDRQVQTVPVAVARVLLGRGG